MQLGFPEFIRITIGLGFFALAIGLVLFVRDIWRVQARVRLSSLNARPDSTEPRPQTLRVLAFMPEALLGHLTRLPGVQLVSAKTISGEPTRFESYFLYKERLFVMEEPSCVTITLLGQPPDKALFAEIEKHVQRYSRLASLPGLIGTAFRCLLLPRNPPRSVIDRYYPDNPAARLAAQRWPAHYSKPATDDAGIDPLAEADVYLAAGQKAMAIQILEQASQAHPMREDVRKRLLELKGRNRQ